MGSLQTGEESDYSSSNLTLLTDIHFTSFVVI